VFINLYFQVSNYKASFQKLLLHKQGLIMINQRRLSSFGLQSLETPEGKKVIAVNIKDFDPKFVKKVSLRKMNNSKSTTTLLPHLSDDIITLRDFTQLQTTRTSSVARIKETSVFPSMPVSARNSILIRESLNILSKDLKSISPSPSVSFAFPKSGISPIQQKSYEKIIVDTSQDFTSPEFLKQLKRLFPKDPRKENKILANNGGVCRYVSTNNAQRIVQWLEDDLRFHRKPKINAVAGSQTDLDLQKHFNEQYMIIENVDSALTDILNICENALCDLKFREKLDGHIQEIIRIVKQAYNSELTVYSYYMLAQVNVARNDIKEAIVSFKAYKDMCMAYKLFKNKIHAYKNLGKCYQDIKKYKAALIYFTKYLQMAWYLDSVKDELLAYDWIGKQYFYMGFTDKAAHYHQKMTSGQIEPRDSKFREVAIKKITLNKDSKNKYPNHELHEKFNFLEEEEEIDEEDNEISAIGEAVDLPQLRKDENKARKNMRRIRDGEMPALTKKEIKLKKIDSFITGLLRAELAKKVLVHKPKKNYEKSHSPKKTRENSNDPFQAFQGKAPKLVLQGRTQSVPKLGPINLHPTPKFLRNTNPNDQVIVSHLSRNRHFKNFNVLAGGIGTDYQGEIKPVATERLGPYEALKVKRVLEKFRANIRLVKESLEICAVDNGINLSQVFSTTRGSKKSFL